ncbi:MAG: ATP-binding protein [Synechococcaceae cyanobacterium SM2_3_1]|nr:ATP-binding protein [Synechococcaceae cyanobacterium SM2_3_1]
MNRCASLILSSQLRELDRLLDWFQQLGSDILPSNTIDQCQLLLSEGFTNVVNHAHEDRPIETQIEIQADILIDSVEIRIWDQGNGFDLESKLTQLLESTPNTEAEGGRGLLIISKIADQLSYLPCDDQRNCLYMIKHYMNQT